MKNRTKTEKAVNQTSAKMYILQSKGRPRIELRYRDGEQRFMYADQLPSYIRGEVAVSEAKS